jgi:hypothetical protein
MAAPQGPRRSCKVTHRGEEDGHGSQARAWPHSPGPHARAHSVFIRRPHVKSLADGRRMAVAPKFPVFTRWPPLNIPRPSCKVTHRGEGDGHGSQARARPLSPHTSSLSLYPMAPLNMPAAHVKSLTGGRGRERGSGTAVARMLARGPSSPDPPHELILSLSDHVFAGIRPASQRRASAHFFKVSCLRFARDLG